MERETEMIILGSKNRNGFKIYSHLQAGMPEDASNIPSHPIPKTSVLEKNICYGNCPDIDFRL